MTDTVIRVEGNAKSGSRAWSIQASGRIRVHHRSCAHAPASLHGRIRWITLGELLDLVKQEEIEPDDICGVCGQQPRHVIAAENQVLR